MFARSLLDERQISYQWVDIDQDPQAAAYVEEVNRGYRSVPTIVFPDGSILVEPSSAELAEKLGIRAQAEHTFSKIRVIR